MCELLDKYWNSGVQHGADSLITNTSWTLQQACESIGSTVEEYTKSSLFGTSFHSS